MPRFATDRLIPCLALALALVGGGARRADGQWYNSYGWGGWNGPSTVGGGIARGLGALAEGAGDLRVETAQAEAIRVRTWMALNDYMYRSNQLRRQQYLERQAAEEALDERRRREMERKELYDPSEADIINGNALNAILHQFANPDVPGSMLDNLGGDLTIAGKEVETIPFKFAQRGVIMSLDRLAGRDGWPASLSGPAFEQVRARYEEILTSYRESPEDEFIPSDRLSEGIAALQEMRDLAEKNLDGPRYVLAERFLRNQLGMLRLANEPQIEELLAEAAGFENVPLPNLISFMALYNLEFGPAETPEQQALYSRTLYPGMRDLRDRAEKELGGPIPTDRRPPAVPAGEAAPAGSDEPIDLFEDRNWDDLRPRSRGDQAPAPRGDSSDRPQGPASGSDRPRSEGSGSGDRPSSGAPSDRPRS